jgi:SAM-dependent methyltransferase
MTHAYVINDVTSPADLPSRATSLAAEIAEIDRQLRRAGQTVPSTEVKRDIARRFWSFVELAAHQEADGTVDDSVRAKCREILGGWLFRSRYFNRSFHKPHGYAGDFMIIEWIYDLETDGCEDPAQPAIVNCLDYLYSTIHAVVSVQQRRRWFSRLLHTEHARVGDGLRVLDVACGGARYIRDFLAATDDASGMQITLVDQDVAALAYCRTRSLQPWVSQIETRSDSIMKLGSHLRGRQYDVIISSGLFDYLNDAIARRLLEQMTSLLAPGGIVAFSNFHVSDPSRVVKDWLVDWPLIYRNDEQCAALLPATLAVATEPSRNRALCYATGRARMP